MRFDFFFIAFGIFSGAAVFLAGQSIPFVKTIPAMMWLLGLILVFDLATAYLRGVPVMESVSTTTRVISFVSGSIVLILLGGMWN